MKPGRVFHAGIRAGFLEAVLAVGVVALVLAPAGPAARASASATCPAVELLGTRGSGEAAAGTSSSGLGQPLDTLNALTPAPATGSSFAWTGGLCTGSGACTLTITGVTAVTGRFSA